MDGGEDRDLHKGGEVEGHEVVVVVDQVKLPRLLHGAGDVEELLHLPVHLPVLPEGLRRGAPQRRPGLGVAGGVEDHLHPEVQKGLGEVVDHLFPGAVPPGGNPPGDGGQHGHPHGRPPKAKTRPRATPSSTWGKTPWTRACQARR